MTQQVERTRLGPSLVQTLKERLEGHKRASGKILLLDISGSMEAADAEGGRRRIDVLAEVCRDIRFRPGAIYAFNNDVYSLVDLTSIPTQGAGGTALHIAFECIKHEVPHLKDVVLVTDGLPDSQTAALRAADGLKVSVIYAGQEGAMPDFLLKLAKLTGGSFESVDLGAPQSLESAVVKGLLGAGK